MTSTQIWKRSISCDLTGDHNIYKEYRDTTLNGAIKQMYTEMSPRHGVRYHCIQVIKTAIIIKTPTIPSKLFKRSSSRWGSRRLDSRLENSRPHTRLQGRTYLSELLLLSFFHIQFKFHVNK
ncbi:putative ribosomal protein 50S-L18Ae/60S-L20/60S-L18A [Helianthus annuus]|nr:putative ribosomal protein 50S-L18Ae/60S-L20/60S-L18A [Helianthus annuus]KAJ0505774.1 putative ribosomal protein 50S-L18Ae/60S-L20/60S-L18A [Helianthus annuus]KAJ0675444.1 putative ribosomal protein 50S-L18Ae/60S-L20/60S-L18A [Helianthus annuus]KAJ0678736.1 putative ribosomal protein 50S-L18Ae/60S-L20/60S-L18A [Helianthus annuus]KAJ0867090.1 putative ribosomal protein 50S-L18Ae/60S-L20/60S-L18A [Helianthus annuus]